MAVAIVSKVVGCGLGARLGGLKNVESLQVGIGMISRGEVGLIVAAIGVAGGLIPDPVFSVVTLIVLASTLVTPPLLRLAFARTEGSHA